MESEYEINTQRVGLEADLAEDIRFLGRLLGEVLRAQEGDLVFDVVETLRASAVRGGKHASETHRRDLQQLLNKLSPHEITCVIRAFSYFSLLANIAEDRHRGRAQRQEDNEKPSPRPGTIAFSLSQLALSGESLKEQLQGFFDSVVGSR